VSTEVLCTPLGDRTQSHAGSPRIFRRDVGDATEVNRARMRTAWVMRIARYWASGVRLSPFNIVGRHVVPAFGLAGAHGREPTCVSSSSKVRILTLLAHFDLNRKTAI